MLSCVEVHLEVKDDTGSSREGDTENSETPNRVLGITDTFFSDLKFCFVFLTP